MVCRLSDDRSMLQIGSVHAQQQRSQQQQEQQQQLAGGPGAGAGAAARTGGMFCYHCPSGLPAPRLPPTLEYPFAPTHPCKYLSISSTFCHVVCFKVKENLENPNFFITFFG